MKQNNPKPGRRVAEGKIILDPTCGGRTIWFDKKHPRALYLDIRKENKGICKERPEFNVTPDMIMNFRDLDLPNGHFRLVVWDPPHLKRLGENSILRKKYGCLNGHWQDDLKCGFREIWRVLDDYGVLIFKWSEKEIPLSHVLKCFSERPLFGHTTGSKSKTHWLTFMKFPEEHEEHETK